MKNINQFDWKGQGMTAKEIYEALSDSPKSLAKSLFEYAQGLEADARRYRHLRDKNLDVIGNGGVFAMMTPQNVVMNGEDLDAAVDAILGPVVTANQLKS